MADTVDVILDYLKRHQFTGAEAALRGELVTRQKSNGVLVHPIAVNLENPNEGNDTGASNRGNCSSESSRLVNPSNQTSDRFGVLDSSSELIVKEVACGSVTIASDTKWKHNFSASGKIFSGSGRHPIHESVGTSENNFGLQQATSNVQRFSIPGQSEDLYPWKFSVGTDTNQKDSVSVAANFSDLEISSQSRYHAAQNLSKSNSTKTLRIPEDRSGWLQNSRPLVLNDPTLKEEKWETVSSWPGCTSNADEGNPEIPEGRELHEVGKAQKTLDYIPFDISSSDGSKHESHRTIDRLPDYAWSKSTVASHPSLETWKDCSIKKIFPFPAVKSSSEYESIPGITSAYSDGSINAGKHVVERQVFPPLSRTHATQMYADISKATDKQTDVGNLGVSGNIENHQEVLPRLPPVKLKSSEKSVNIHWQEKVGCYELGPKPPNMDTTFSIGSLLDVPVGQDINSSGGRKTTGTNWLSVSQGIAEDNSDFVSVFTTAGDGLSMSVDYPNDKWDFDEYEDADDVGYTRQPIEDETWFLAHEIDYPSDNEKGTGAGGEPELQERVPPKDDDDQSFAEDSYFSGEQYIQSKNNEYVAVSEDPIGSMTEMYRGNDDKDLIAQYDGQLREKEELNLVPSEPVWQGFVAQSNEFIILGKAGESREHKHSRHDDLCIDEDQHGSVRSIGVGINSDTADFCHEIHESLVGKSDEGDLEYFPSQAIIVSGSKQAQNEKQKRFVESAVSDKTRPTKILQSKGIIGRANDDSIGIGYSDDGFVFPPHSRSEQEKPDWSRKCEGVSVDNETDDCDNGRIEEDDMLSWRRKGSESSPVKRLRDEDATDTRRSAQSTSSTVSNSDYYAEKEHTNHVQDQRVSDARDEDGTTTLEDEESAAVQEQIRQLKAQEDEFETFDLKIVHRKNRTGFEEDKNFHVVLNSVIAGRYHVTEYLGSAAFSKAIQAHDLHTGMDVCVKIIKNNKDFFDQSLDEIKLLKYVNKHDPADKYHILQLSIC